jgi:hypothetical protein
MNISDIAIGKKQLVWKKRGAKITKARVNDTISARTKIEKPKNEKE